jgi:hypothetical protein
MHGVDMLRALKAAADKGKAGAIEHHDADAGPIGKGFEGHLAEVRNRRQQMISVLGSFVF